MKEFKNNKNNENKSIDEIVEKKFKEDLNEIKEKLNAEKLSDEFKEKLLSNLENELNKDDSKNENKVINFPVISRKLAGICACFIFLFTSCFAFADEIENIFLNFFSNTDKVIERAIENGTYKEIDMDYVEDNGVSIKVDYIISEEDCLYIAFNVKSNEEFNKFFISELDIMDQDNYILYSNGSSGYFAMFSVDKQFIDKNNIISIYKLSELKKSPSEMKNFKINIKKIYFYDNEKDINKIGNWEINI